MTDTFDAEGNREAVTAIATESPEAAGLVYALVAQSMNNNNAVIDQLLEAEREMRMALEVRVQEFLWAADKAFGGTVREYEAAIALLRYPTGTDKEYAARHEFYASYS